MRTHFNTRHRQSGEHEGLGCGTNNYERCQESRCNFGREHVTVRAKCAQACQRVKKKILKPQPKETVPVEEEELGDASIRRTQQGRDNIKKIMKNLFELDKAVFPNAPAFDTLGRCRLKFQGADSYLWPDLLEASGRTFECMYLGDVNDVGQCTPRSSYPKDVVHSLCGLV